MPGSIPENSLQALFSAPVRGWFENRFEAPTAVQLEAWGEIASGRDTLVAAPTGSGKTLAAFLCAIDDLVGRSRQSPLEDRVYVLYVSPLKALSNDIHRNLEDPLAGIEERLAADRAPPTGIRAKVRTGDTPAGDRAKMAKRPPHILVTTPESLYLLLTSASGRAMLGATETVIVDEIHAVAGNKRGSHLALSLARLDALCGRRPRRIGLSATQKPIATIANYLTGGGDCSIVDSGHQRERDIQLELTPSPLTAVMSNEVWSEIHDRLADLVEAHRTTLIFVNTRRLAERIARHLAERLGEESVTAHHGSLSRLHRLESEQALKAGKLRALVATASLELGIDIGYVDLVCQLGSPGSLSAFLQRVGRSGHSVGALPKGRLFPLSRDDLVESVALVRAVERGDLDTIHIPEAPLDVLSQQIVAEVSAREWTTEELLVQLRGAWPYRSLGEKDFHGVVRMLAEGYTTRRLADQFDYDVVMLPQGHRIGTLGEDFAFESLPGDIFQLGNTSYRILKVETGRVLVEDAAGLPPNLPFWVGDRPGRSNELSDAVSDLRVQLETVFKESGPEAARTELQADGVDPVAAEQLVEYLYAAWQALECLPTRNRIVLERFFDDTGDMHLVLHAPLGSRLMRAWGLALRKRFCRQFNFELQASALEDALILSLGETHSFDLQDVTGYLQPETVEQVLIQALLDAPMFEARWRWNATIALAVQRMRNGKRLPPQWQRNQAEDLVSVVFPDQIACLENIAGAREIPDHPLVGQTIDDCLRVNMDIDGLVQTLERLRNGELEVRCADLTGPSPLSREIINARPYAFLDDGEAENRRTRAISGEPDDLGRAETLKIISVEARQQVRDEAWIAPRNADELHDGMLQLGFLAESEYRTGNSLTGAGGNAARWAGWFELLAEQHRACRVALEEGPSFWVAAERINEFCALHPGAKRIPEISAPQHYDRPWAMEEALVALLRDRLSGLGPVSQAALAASLSLETAKIAVALTTLQAQGYAIRMENGRAGSDAEETWCERRLLARIHRYSREHRRKAVKPVTQEAFARFLFRWHQLEEPGQLDQALAQLEGWSAPVDTWEHSLIRVRSAEVDPAALDQRFLSGEIAWFRPLIQSGGRQQVVSASPVALVPRAHMDAWRGERKISPETESTNSSAEKIRAILERRGAVFTADLERETGLLAPQLEDGLKALVYQGAVTADAFSPLRWLLRPESRKNKMRGRVARGGRLLAPVGRWSLVEHGEGVAGESGIQFTRQQHMATLCHALLQRYGVVFRAVLERETLLPPWRELLRYFRRMEDRGEVRGGRFMDGFSGEQFALPEALGLLRQCMAPASRAPLAVISASDPLNLGGIIVPGAKTPAQAGNRILLEDGMPVARLVGDEVEEFAGISRAASQWAREKLRIVTPWRKRHS
jgi:ATP-dependent Lhr-like helicase